MSGSRCTWQVRELRGFRRASRLRGSGGRAEVMVTLRHGVLSQGVWTLTFFFREQGMYVTILSRCRVIYLARGVFMRVDVSDETVNTLRDARFFGTEGPCEATVIVHLQQAVPRSVPPCQHKACVSDHKTLCFQDLRCSEDQICVGVCCRKSSAFFCIHLSV